LATFDESHEKWALDVLDKQYRLYSWNDQKTHSLITANAFLFAAVGFTYDRHASDVMVLLFQLLAVAMLAASALFCVTHLVPYWRSGKSGRESNIRSLRGIGEFPNWQSYAQTFAGVDRNRFVTDCLRQVYGMSRNSWRSRTLVTRGVALTMVGVICLVLILVAQAVSARGVHLLGEWSMVSTATAARPVTTTRAPRTLPTAAPRPHHT
jgi:hypothetical protein